MDEIRTLFKSLSPREQKIFLDELQKAGFILGVNVIPGLFSPQVSILDKITVLGVQFFDTLCRVHNFPLVSILDSKGYDINKFCLFELVIYYCACQYRKIVELAVYEPFNLENEELREILKQISKSIVLKYCKGTCQLPYSIDEVDRRGNTIYGINKQNADAVSQVVARFERQYTDNLSDDELIQLLYQVITCESESPGANPAPYIDVELLRDILGGVDHQKKLSMYEQLRCIYFGYDAPQVEFRYIHDFGNHGISSSPKSVFERWRDNHEALYQAFLTLLPIILLSYNEKMIAQQFGISSLDEVDKIKIVHDGMTLFISDQLEGVQYEHSQLVFLAIHLRISKLCESIVDQSQGTPNNNILKEKVNVLKTFRLGVEYKSDFVLQESDILDFYNALREFVLACKVPLHRRTILSRVRDKIQVSKQTVDQNGSVIDELESFLHAAIEFYGISQDNVLLLLRNLGFYNQLEEGEKYDLSQMLDEILIPVYQVILQNAPIFSSVLSEILVPSAWVGVDNRH